MYEAAGKPPSATEIKLRVREWVSHRDELFAVHLSRALLKLLTTLTLMRVC